jgi:hypothetical protein
MIGQTTNQTNNPPKDGAIRPFYYYIYTEVNEVVFEVIFASSSLLHLLLFKQRKRRIILHPAILVVATLHHQFALQ